MLRPRRRSRREPVDAPELQLYHEPALTGHVSQLDTTRQQPRTSSLPTPSPGRPFTLDFPTLNIDGSVPDITAHQTRRYPPTPPAALSSLGARSRMDRPENVSELEGSFADNQYDMLDDLSEISTDDHETASIASNGDDGQLTPDEAGSEADVEDSTVLFEEGQQMLLPPSASASYVNLSAQAGSFSPLPPSPNVQEKMKAENDVIDSYMSEDLETPRQSAMPNAFSSTWYRPRSSGAEPSSSSQSTSAEPRHMLFISEQDIAQFEMDQICSKVAASMMSADTEDAASNKVVRLPTPPSGIHLPTATAVYGRDRISATLQHCVGVEVRSPGSYKLRVMDFDGEHSSFFTVGKDAKIDLTKPDVTVFYVNAEANGGYSAWLNTAFEAVEKLNVPVIAILDPYLNVKAKRSWSKRCIKSKVETHVYMDAVEFLAGDTGSILDAPKLLSKRPTRLAHFVSQAKKSGPRKKRATEVSWLKLLFMFCVAVVPYLLLPFIRSSSDPVLDTAVRREALGAALEKMNIPSAGTGAANLDHLLPTPEPACVSQKDVFGGFRMNEHCNQDSRNQGLTPNHIIVSLPTLPRTPQLCHTRVVKNDGRQLAFNQTKLIDGVWDVTIDPQEAYGIINVNMLTQKPFSNITASHNFGNRMLQRKTYEKAGTEVGKAVSKDVAVMRDAAESLKSKFANELSATKNMTTQLGLHVARDLLVFGNTAAAMFGKVAQAGNQTATALTKDFVLMQRDLVKFTKDLSTNVKSTVDAAKSSSKALIKNPLALSRGRLQGLKEAIAGKKKAKRGSGATCGRGSLKDRLKTLKSTRALSVVPESAPPIVTNNAEFVSQKTKLKKATQQLDALVKRAKRQGQEKMSRTDLRKLKKDVKRQEKLVKKMRAEMHNGAPFA